MFCVFSYISQIVIIESARLEVAGTLAFPGATIPIDQDCCCGHNPTRSSSYSTAHKPVPN